MKSHKNHPARLFPLSWRDLLVSAGILLCALGLCILLQIGIQDNSIFRIVLLLYNSIGLFGIDDIRGIGRFFLSWFFGFGHIVFFTKTFSSPRFLTTAS